LFFPPAAPIAVPVAGGDAQFAVRRVYCVGRNYADMRAKWASIPSAHRRSSLQACRCIVPSLMAKHSNCLIVAERNYHYEGRTRRVIGKSGSDLGVEQALDHVWGYAVGLDMTRRDLQMKMREMGRPGNRQGVRPLRAMGPIHPASAAGHFEKAGSG